VEACLDVYHPDVFVIPETCWRRVFEVAALVRRRGVRVVGIPNVELVRKDEVARHLIFHALVANNRLCEGVLRDAVGGAAAAASEASAPETPPVIEWTGFAMPVTPTPSTPPAAPAAAAASASASASAPPLMLLLLGGSNVDGRKQGPKIVRALYAAAAAASAASAASDRRVVLTLRAQTAASSAATRAFIEALDMSKVHGRLEIDFQVGNLDMSLVQRLHQTHDVALMPSKHEGLGMGFHEAMSEGCAVLTVDAQPHNEMVSSGRTGWLLPCSQVPMVENLQSLVSSSDVDEEALRSWAALAFAGTLGLPRRSDVQKAYAEDHPFRSFAARFAGAVLGVAVPLASDVSSHDASLDDDLWDALPPLAAAPIHTAPARPVVIAPPMVPIRARMIAPVAAPVPSPALVPIHPAPVLMPPHQAPMLPRGRFDDFGRSDRFIGRAGGRAPKSRFVR